MSSKSPQYESKAQSSPLYWAGKEIGKYKLDKFLGSGGSAEVWEAIRQPWGDRVALKLPNERSLDNGSANTRLKREADLSLEHPCIRRVEFVPRDADSWSFLKMELLRGKSLREEIRAGKPLHLRRTCNIGRQISSALVLLHAHGIVHRDVSARNIILVEGAQHQDAAKLIDFGLAIHLESDEKRRSLQVHVGTQGYVAPEHIKQPGMITCKADVFSLGVILLECLSGELRWDWFKRRNDGKFDALKYLDSLRETSVLLGELSADVPADLKDLLGKALEQDPDKRIDIHAMFDALAQYADVHVPAIPRHETMLGAHDGQQIFLDESTELDESNETLKPISRSMLDKNPTPDLDESPQRGEIDHDVATQRTKKPIRTALGWFSLLTMMGASALLAGNDRGKEPPSDNSLMPATPSSASFDQVTPSTPEKEGLIAPDNETDSQGKAPDSAPVEASLNVIKTSPRTPFRQRSMPKSTTPNGDALPSPQRKLPEVVTITEKTTNVTPKAEGTAVPTKAPIAKSEKEQETEATLRKMGLTPEEKP